MKRSKVLIVDAAINLILGVLLITFPPKVAQLLGVPLAKHLFYPSILGGVLIGIGIALLIEYFRRAGAMVGLGLGGAIAINLCVGLVLAVWLVSGMLNIPFRGQITLWILVLILIAISGVELFAHRG